MEIDYAKFMEGSGRWFRMEDYPTGHHCKTSNNGALWSWIWFSSFENGSNGNGEQKVPLWKSLRMTGIKTRKEYRRALRDLEALGLIEIVKVERSEYKNDIIKIIQPNEKR